MSHLSWLEINLKNLQSNVYRLKSLLNPQTKFMAVVKANAYGHGMIECSRAAIEAGADWLGVVSLDEALELRRNLSSIVNRPSSFPILVMGYVEPKAMSLAAENNISVAVVSIEHLQEILKSLKPYNLKSSLKIHLKIETGINRLGLKLEELPQVLKLIYSTPLNLYPSTPLYLEGIYSHFASVEEHNLNYAQKQIAIFKKTIQFVNPTPLNLYPSKPLPLYPSKPIFHLASSASTLLLPESHFDMVRCGIAIYGLWPSPETMKSFLEIRNSKHEIRNKSKIQNPKFGKQFNHLTIQQLDNFLQSVLSYKTKIVQIKKVAAGESIGYGCTYKVKKPMTVAVIPVGYYEGIDRGLSNPSLGLHSRGELRSEPHLGSGEGGGCEYGEVLIAGQRCPIVGRVCMNMAVIDITEIRNSKFEIRNKGVVIIGKQSKAEITVDEIAEKLGTINYEVTTRIPAHIPRLFIS